jgi:hypothetical protein
MTAVRKDQTKIAAQAERKLAMVRADAISAINEAAAKARLRYITDLPGQQMIYLAKQDEATAYLAANHEPATLAAFPFLAAEVGITAPTAYELAQIWLNMAALWISVATQIERQRMVEIKLIQSMTDAEAVITASPSEMRRFVP